jgi:hypothetical protein
MRTREKGPRFHNQTVIPDLPDSLGLQVVKFRSRPAVVPRVEEGEERLGSSGLTRRQIRALAFLDRSPVGKINEEALAVVALSTKNPDLKERIESIYQAYTIAVAGGEQFIASGLIRQALILQEFAP